MRSPSMSRQAIFASGTPIALETNGTVREARGLASMTNRRPSSVTAYWMLMSPTVFRPSAMPRVCARISSSISGPSECGGSTQALSPEWIPASSTCCMIPPIQTRLAVAQRVDVDLDRVLQEAVEEDLALACARPLPRPAQVVGEVLAASRRSPSRARRARSSGARAAGSRRSPTPPAPPRRRARWRTAAPRSRAALEQRAEAPAVLGEVDRVDARAEDRHARRPAGRRRASAASGRRTARSRPRAARSRRRRARPRASAARSTGGRTCRSPSRRSRGCS